MGFDSSIQKTLSNNIHIKIGGAGGYAELGLASTYIEPEDIINFRDFMLSHFNVLKNDILITSIPVKSISNYSDVAFTFTEELETRLEDEQNNEFVVDLAVIYCEIRGIKISPEELKSIILLYKPFSKPMIINEE